MKKKINKIVVPIFLAVFCGFLCGRLMFSIYEEKGSSVLDSNIIYLLEDSTYNNYEEMKANTLSSNYIYYEELNFTSTYFLSRKNYTHNR